MHCRFITTVTVRVSQMIKSLFTFSVRSKISSAGPSSAKILKGISPSPQIEDIFYNRNPENP